MNADTLLSSTKTENDEDDEVENLFPESNPVTTISTAESANSDNNSCASSAAKTTDELIVASKRSKSSDDEFPKMKSVEEKVLLNIDKKMNEVKKILNAPPNINNNFNNNKNSNLVQKSSSDNSNGSNTSSSSSLLSLMKAKEQSHRRVSFPKNDDDLVTGYLEPVDPWACGELQYDYHIFKI